MLKPFTTLLTLTLFAGAISTTLGQTRYDRSLSLASAEPGDPAVGGDGGVAGPGSSLDASAGSAELAKKLQNPVASLISVPIQNNFDFGAGTDGDGFQYKVNIQPVIPFSVSEDWNLITRTILPVIVQKDVIGDASQAGLSDTSLSLFLSPKESSIIWGVGPVILMPTATDSLLGSGQWGAGPSAVVLKQQGPWTVGALASHTWSFAGWGDRSVNATFLQPFLAYTTKKQTTFGLNTETTHDWQDTQWTVPLNATVAQLVKIGRLPVQFLVGGRYYAERPEYGPDWGLRFGVSLVFPK